MTVNYKNWCQLEVDHIKEENLNQVKEIVFDTLQTLIKKGIDRQQLEATLAYLELNLKERNFGLFEGESEDLNPHFDDFGYDDLFPHYGGERKEDVQKKIKRKHLQM